METLISKYIEANKLSWSSSTRVTAAATLRAVAPSLDGNPETLWAAIQYQKPYTRQTTWTRVCRFWSWAHPKKPNPYLQWRQSNALAFKNSYKKERLEVTYEQALEKIKSISDQAIQRRALEILYSAQRYCEVVQPLGADILGKGAKTRPNFRPELPGPQFDKHYVTFYRALKKVGLKPHTLRKLALTRMVDKGATAYDLMEVAGWSSIQTASSYIQPKETARLKEMLKG